MAGEEPGIWSEIASAVRNAIAARGVDVDSVLQPANGVITAGASADLLFERAAIALNDDAVAISIAAVLPVGALGVLDYAICTSATLRDAMSRLESHYRIMTQRAQLDFLEEGERAILRFDRRPGHDPSYHWFDFGLALVGARIRQTVASDIAFTRVTCARAAPTDPSPYERHFGRLVDFGAPDTRLEIARSHLDRPLMTASPQLADLLEARIRALGPARDVADPLVDRVRRTIGALLDERSSDMGKVARRLGMSPRTLQRRLAALGTSTGQVLDDLRRARAVELLARGDRVADVALAVGFADPSTFFRAYRRWTGSTPKATKG